MKQTTFLACILVSAAAHGGEIYKWVDASGQVHYGNSISKSQKNDVVKVDVYAPAVTDQQRQEAEARTAKEKESLKPKPVASTSFNTPAVSSVAAASAVQGYPSGVPYTDKKLKCEEEWRKYRESLDCIAPYKTRLGGFRQEALEHCTILKSPAELCDF